MGWVVRQEDKQLPSEIGYGGVGAGRSVVERPEWELTVCNALSKAARVISQSALQSGP